MSSNDVEEKDLGGRPKEGIKSGQHANAMGWDPTGRKELKQQNDLNNIRSTFQPVGKERRLSLSKESRDFVNNLSKNSATKVLFESKLKTDSDAGTLLDEKNIL
jgi:hypothetical protein